MCIQSLEGEQTTGLFWLRGSFAYAAVKQIESPGPCILNETADSMTMQLDSLCVHIPDGSRQLCQVGLEQNACTPHLPQALHYRGAAGAEPYQTARCGLAVARWAMSNASAPFSLRQLTCGRCLQDLNVELAKGQSLLVVGQSGCGKSSILRAIAGAQPSYKTSVW